MPEITLYGPHGKPINANVAAASMKIGAEVSARLGNRSLSVQKDGDRYCSRCAECDFGCRLTEPLAALDWAVNHLAKFHGGA